MNDESSTTRGFGVPAFTQDQGGGLSSNLSKDEIARCLVSIRVRTKVVKKYREKRVTSTFALNYAAWK